jgi:tRNA modification GTPase
VLHRLYEGWRQELLEAMALMEAGLDFADEEDVAGDAFERARRVVVALEGKIRAHLDDGRRGEILREGFRLVLAGPPNVGKSSLLNALAQREAAIVSPEAGTTRDVIEVRLDLGGYPVVISDTAGLREAAGAVEQEGIRRTLQQSRTADAILWVVDATSPNYEMPSEIAECGARIIEVLNKSDRVSASSGSQDERALRVSALTGDGLGRLVARVVELAAERIGAGDGPAITQARHREALTASRASLQDYLARDLAMPEIAAEDLRLASRALGRITGAVDPEEVLGRIFARFCIGK